MLPDYCQVSVEPPKFSSLPDKVPPFFIYAVNIFCLHSTVTSGGRFDFFVPFPLLKMELVFFFARFWVKGLVCSVWNIVFSLCKLMIFFFWLWMLLFAHLFYFWQCVRARRRRRRLRRNRKMTSPANNLWVSCFSSWCLVLSVERHGLFLVRRPATFIISGHTTVTICPSSWLRLR